MGEIYKMRSLYDKPYKNERNCFFKWVSLNRMMKKEGAGKQQYTLIPTISIDIYSKQFNPGHLYYNSIGIFWAGFCFMFYFARPEAKAKDSANIMKEDDKAT